MSIPGTPHRRLPSSPQSTSTATAASSCARSQAAGASSPIPPSTSRSSVSCSPGIRASAYHQPVTREGIRAVRGVNSDGVINSLREKGLVREVGRESDRGQAILYGTTQLFLEHFGLRSLRDLPPLEDFAPDEESKRFIRERLSGSSFASTLEEAADDLDDERLLGEDSYDEDDVYDELEDILDDDEVPFDD